MESPLAGPSYEATLGSCRGARRPPAKSSGVFHRYAGPPRGFVVAGWSWLSRAMHRRADRRSLGNAPVDFTLGDRLVDAGGRLGGGQNLPGPARRIHSVDESGERAPGGGCESLSGGLAWYLNRLRGKSGKNGGQDHDGLGAGSAPARDCYFVADDGGSKERTRRGWFDGVVG